MSITVLDPLDIIDHSTYRHTEQDDFFTLLVTSKQTWPSFKLTAACLKKAEHTTKER